MFIEELGTKFKIEWELYKRKYIDYTYFHSEHVLSTEYKGYCSSKIWYSFSQNHWNKFFILNKCRPNSELGTSARISLVCWQQTKNTCSYSGLKYRKHSAIGTVFFTCPIAIFCTNFVQTVISLVIGTRFVSKRNWTRATHLHGRLAFYHCANNAITTSLAQIT